jgi:hypothetical protein
MGRGAKGCPGQQLTYQLHYRRVECFRLLETYEFGRWGCEDVKARDTDFNSGRKLLLQYLSNLARPRIQGLAKSRSPYRDWQARWDSTEHAPRLRRSAPSERRSATPRFALLGPFSIRIASYWPLSIHVSTCPCCENSSW